MHPFPLRKCAVVFAIGCLVGCSSLVCAKPTENVPAAFSKEQAEALASQFASALKIDLPPLVDAAPDNDDGQPIEWRLEYSDDRTRVVMSVSAGLVARYSRRGGLDKGQAVDTQSAAQVARSALTAAGAFQHFDFTEQGVHNAGRGQWAVDWARTYRTIPYHNEITEVRVDAASGSVTLFGIIARMATPKSIAVTVDAPAALASATKSLASKAIQGLDLFHERLEIVTPNRGWDKAEEDEDDPVVSPSRVVWSVLLRTSDKMRCYDVWVDAATGRIVGGELMAMR